MCENFFQPRAQSSVDVHGNTLLMGGNEDTLRYWAKQVLLPRPQFLAYIDGLQLVDVLTDADYNFRCEMAGNLPLLKRKLLEYRSLGNSSISVQVFARDINWLEEAITHSQPIKQSST